MIASRVKTASVEVWKKQVLNEGIHKLETFIDKRDYTGAVKLLEFHEDSNYPEKDLWVAYCYFHLGDYLKASAIYEYMINGGEELPNIPVYLSCCYFFLGRYSEARNFLERAPNSPLKNRISFHLFHKMNNKEKLGEYSKKSEGVLENQLSLASLYYSRAHYQQAIDIYKKVLLNERDFSALNVYVALCYYKLDYYDATQEILEGYLQRYPDSIIANNLKACNHFRLYNQKAGLADIKWLNEKLSDSYNFGNDLIKHNMVVFQSGEGALQVLPNLIDIIPEARFNLVIYHLKHHEVQEAYELIKDIEPIVSQEYILKGIVNAVIGQETASRDYIKTAQQYFHLVGSSNSECDTIPGRQSMASCFFLFRQFEEVLIYLNSIKTYFVNEDTFNMNYAQAQAAAGYYTEAEEAFLAVRSEKYKNDFIYISLLAYCYIVNKKSQLAWELYVKMDTSAESLTLLRLIANTFYESGEFWYAAKAFDELEKIDSSPEHWEGKRGACCGVFQQIIAKKLPKKILPEIIQLLRNTFNLQAEQIIRVMRKWGEDNEIPC